MDGTLEREHDRLGALILASENWAPGYDKAPVQHAKLLTATARLTRKLKGYFKDQTNLIPQVVNWHAYRQALSEVKADRIDAYDISVIVNDQPITDTWQAFISIVLEELTIGTALGAQAGEEIYNVPLGLNSASATIQRLAREQAGKLVSRKIDKNGQMVEDSSNSAYSITDTTIKNIQESIRTSLDLGEDIQAATDRLQSVIYDRARAELIAQTEMVNAYASGQHQFGIDSGAVFKQWQDNGATDICATNTAAGPVPINDPYPSGDQHPTAHPRCRCWDEMIYPEYAKKLGLL